MENNIFITDNSHNKIYQTYAELKKKLPPNFFKIKVFSSPKYNFDKKPLLKKIENDKININYKNDKSLSINKFSNHSQNIYILSNKTIKLKKQRNINPIFLNEQKNEDILKKTLLTEKDKNDKKIYNNTEQNKDNNYELDQNPDESNYQGYYFHSNAIKDVHMKNNIYLPKIIDRMKYNIPRNERDKNGFHVKGIGIFHNNKLKYDDINDNYELNINNYKENNENYEDKDNFKNNNI